MTERIRFYFDPICPWSYQTSRWARRLEELGELELDWGLFSLELQNAGDEPEDMHRRHDMSARALRTAVLVRQAAGSRGVGAFYAAIGARVHEQGASLDDPVTVDQALGDIGLDPALSEQAMADSGTWDAVVAEHRGLVERTRSFGVPTLVLDGDEGPAIFGPVLSTVPSDEEAVELLRHVVWLARYENFSELKRERTVPPDLESVRQFLREQEVSSARGRRPRPD